MSQDNIYEAPKSNVVQNLNHEELKDILIVAKRQKTLLRIFLLYFIIAGLSGIAGEQIRPLIQILMLPLMLAFIVSIARLCWRLYSKVAAIIMTIFSIVPLINFLILLAVNSRATGLLRKKGFKVGFMGANIKEFS